MHSTHREGRAWRVLAVAAAAAIVAACGGGGGSSTDPGNVQIQALNTRADMVTNGDALVQVTMPTAAQVLPTRIQLGSRDVTSAFTRRSDGSLVGLVTGLAEGANTLTATVGDRTATLTLTNTPRGQTLISGAPLQPFFCAGPTPVVGSGSAPTTTASGLAGAADANCSIPAETKLYYKTTTAGCSLSLPDPKWEPSATATTIGTQPAAAANACFKPYDPAAARPADMAQATTDAGQTVDYIVRVERGTLNRGIYDVAVLYQPGAAWTPVAPQSVWNGKVYYSFGSSTGQPRRQIRPQTAWTSLDEQLKRGWMVVMNSMTDSARNSNRVMMSETVMMMKEHIGDTYGPIKYTLGTGCSGGSINSNMNASINPGLLDGIVTTCTYPDSETTSLEVGDCTSLVEAYQKPELLTVWTNLGLNQTQINARKAAINGHTDPSHCQAWFNAFGSNGRAGVYNQRTVGLLGGSTAQNQADWLAGTIRTSPTATNNCELPNSAVYDPANPAATASLPRCNAWAWGENIWGKANATQARDTRDNVGVQYGLKALTDGTISAEEFVVLNEVIGGVDRDSTPTAARTRADTEALTIAYRAGIVASGKQLAKTAIIDLRGWDDSNIIVPPGQTAGANAIPIHAQWFSFAVRDRIAAESDSKDARNQALWRFARTGLTPPGTMAVDAFLAMDQWLAALVTDKSSASMEQKVRAARPASTADFCVLPSDTAQTTRITDQAVCDADPFLKPSLSPRQVAGGPRAENILKCQLKPLVQTDYAGGTFTAGQWTRLQAVFPDGVCDWSKPGVGQQAAASPLTFKAGPGGQPLPAAPVSVLR